MRAQETPARVEDGRECPQPARVRPAANAGQGLLSAIRGPAAPAAEDSAFGMLLPGVRQQELRCTAY